MKFKNCITPLILNNITYLLSIYCICYNNLQLFLYAKENLKHVVEYIYSTKNTVCGKITI